MPPLVSVVIPTYNRSTWIREAIRSVRTQDFQDYELIVVDDGSDQGLTHMPADGKALDGYLYTRHGGVSRARNLGAGVCRGTWLSFLDSDDLWTPRKLSRQMAFLQENTDYLVCYTDEVWIRRGVRVNPMKKHQKYSGWIFPHCLPLCLISPSSVILKRTLFESMGGFDETLPVCEDYDLWLRIASRYPIAYLQEKLIVKRGGHEDQLSRSEWGMDRFRVLALQKLLNLGVLDWTQERATLLELMKKCRILMQGLVKRGREEEALLYRQIVSESEIRMQNLESMAPSGDSGPISG